MGRQPSGGGVNVQFSKISEKLHEIERICTPKGGGGGTRPKFYYVDPPLKGLDNMLATKKSAGVAPKVNLRILLHTGDKPYKKGIHPDFQSQVRLHQKSKNRGISGPTERTNASKN